MGMILTEASVITNTSGDTRERLNKEQEYLDYIKSHIANIRKVYEIYLMPLLDKENISTMITDDELKSAIKEVEERIKTHDDSKFADAEFNDYRAHWYPTTEELAIDDDAKQLMNDRYEEAYRHHVTTNDHHPEHWKDENGNPIDMTLPAILEMILDWISFSFRNHDEGSDADTLEWYENKAIDEKKAMTDHTKKLLEEVLYRVLFGKNPPEEKVEEKNED